MSAIPGVAPRKAGAKTSRYVAFIRGINVGRANRVAMADLRRVIGRLGYTGVRTLLNSGNVVFDAAVAPPADLAACIGDAMADEFGLRPAVIVVTAAEIADVLDGNPLSAVASDPSRMLVTFLATPDGSESLRPLLRQDWKPEALALGEHVAYLWCPGGVAASPLVQAVARESGDAGTMRNWATVARIGAVATSDL